LTHYRRGAGHNEENDTVTRNAMLCEDIHDPFDTGACIECGAHDPFEGAEDCANCRAYTMSILEEHYERSGVRLYMPVCALT